VPGLPFWGDGKRGIGFLMKGAKAFKIAPGAFKGDVLADKRNYVYGFFNSLCIGAHGFILSFFCCSSALILSLVL